VAQLVKPYHERIRDDRWGYRHYWRLHDDFRVTQQVKDEAPWTSQMPGTCEPPVAAPGHFAQVPIPVGGDLNLAAQFDGVGYIEVPYSDSPNAATYNSSLNPVDDLSVEAWVNPNLGDLANARMMIAGTYQPGSNAGFWLDLLPYNGKLWAEAVVYAPTGFTQATVPLEATLDGWYYVAMSYTKAGNPTPPVVAPQTLMVFLIYNTYNTNGKMQSGMKTGVYQAVQTGNPNANAPFRIGASGGPPQSFFKGLMCDVALYNWALTETNAQDRFIWGTTP
jgi:hypothetical protein